MIRHLLVDISAHGYGHLAQTACVLHALRERMPMRLTVRCALPAEVIRRRLGEDVLIIPGSGDVAMRMASSIDVLAAESAADYRRFHSDWERSIEDEVQWLAAIKPDLILSNIGYRILAAARRAGVAAAALCSLNWADIFASYCTEPEHRPIEDQIRAAYRQADLFIQPTPHMPMEDLPARRSIGPVAARCRFPADQVRERLGLSQEQRLVMVNFGGIPLSWEQGRWPRIDTVRWLVPESWRWTRPDAMAVERLGVDYLDLLGASDALITKPGYGSFAEAACNGIRVLYVPRGDWPEEPYLTAWIESRGAAAAIDRGSLEQGRIAGTLSVLLDQPVPAPVEPSGVEAAAALLGDLLRHRQPPRQGSE